MDWAISLTFLFGELNFFCYHYLTINSTQFTPIFYPALIMFAACIVIMCVLSLFTRPVPLDLLGALTWKTINKPRFKEGMKSAEYTVSADLKLDDVRISSKFLLTS